MMAMLGFPWTLSALLERTAPVCWLDVAWMGLGYDGHYAGWHQYDNSVAHKQDWTFSVLLPFDLFKSFNRTGLYYISTPILAPILKKTEQTTSESKEYAKVRITQDAHIIHRINLTLEKETEND